MAPVPEWVERAVELLGKGKLTAAWVAGLTRRKAEQTGATIDEKSFETLFEECCARDIPMERAFALQDEMGFN